MRKEEEEKSGAAPSAYSLNPAFSIEEERGEKRADKVMDYERPHKLLSIFVIRKEGRGKKKKKGGKKGGGGRVCPACRRLGEKGKKMGRRRKKGAAPQYIPNLSRGGKKRKGKRKRGEEGSRYHFQGKREKEGEKKRKNEPETRSIFSCGGEE